MRNVLALLLLLFSGCTVQQNSIIHSFGTEEGFNCSHVVTHDVAGDTVVVLCRDMEDHGKVVIASSQSFQSLTFSAVLGYLGAVGMAVVTPLIVAL